MKKCKYCDTVRKSNIEICPGCGAKEFSYKCDNCGAVFEGGTFCPNCGVKDGLPPKKCVRCGTEYYSNACPNCGYKPFADEFDGIKNDVKSGFDTVNSYVHQPTPPNAKRKWIAFTLCLLLGYMGVHKFYEGKTGMGILYLLTGGLFMIGWIIDIFILLGKPDPYYV